jgi:hypothetical protein
MAGLWRALPGRARLLPNRLISLSHFDAGY